MSSSSVATVSKVAGWDATASPSVSVPTIGDTAVGSAVITTKCSHDSTSPNPAYPSDPIGSSGVPSKQKYAFASESAR
ncbi:hypothetical protein GALL_443170 [mine drainage metagenome]|uniref:Uncharacterized protein n=1 Tax=mine drainage metagenome TaxID=410659 RepID=A0A1J5PRB7_9ZZZZ